MKFKDRISYLLAVYEQKAQIRIYCQCKQTYLDDFSKNEAVI